MFLDESFDLLGENQYPEITADPACGMEIMLESVEAYNKVEMAMIHLEHTAIVNEDASLLAEGKEGFKDKVKQVGKNVKERFLLWLAKVRQAWTEMNVKIRNKFFSNREIMKRAEANYNAVLSAFYENSSSTNKVKKAIEIGKLFTNDINSRSYTSSKAVELMKSKCNAEVQGKVQYNEILVLLKNRETYVTAIKKFEGEVKKIEDEAKDVILNMQRIATNAVSAINAGTTQAMSLLSRAVRKAGIKKEKKGSDDNKSESYSILDAFMFD